jgi:hypothetical protein
VITPPYSRLTAAYTPHEHWGVNTITTGLTLKLDKSRYAFVAIENEHTSTDTVLNTIWLHAEELDVLIERLTELRHAMDIYENGGDA